MSIRVFLVDDDPLVRSSLRLYFETTDDISVVAEAANGAECLSMLDNVDADIILADIHMPTMDGITLLRKIKERPYPPVFLAVTSFDSDDTMLKTAKEVSPSAEDASSEDEANADDGERRQGVELLLAVAQLALFLFDDESAMVRIDMSEYGDARPP